MKEKIRSVIDAVFEEVVSAYERNHQIIFPNESERKGQHYRGVKNRLKNWSKKKTCIYRGCTAKSIKRSHTIQKSASLKVISENSVVMTPEFNHEIGKIDLVERGISESSVFPGFCSVHEKLFESFENTKSLNDATAIALQIYRSICREIIRKEHDLKHMKEFIASYTKYRNERINELIVLKLGNEWLESNDIRLGEMNFSHDPILAPAIEYVDDANKTLDVLKNGFLKEIEDDLDGIGTISLRPVCIKIDARMPVTLSGLGSFYVKDGASSKRILVVLGVYPSADHTLLLIHSKHSDSNYVDAYLSRIKTSLDILNMVEEWMIRGTDHWFLSPSVWKNKTEPCKRLILDEIMDSTKGLLHPLDVSIFNEMRETIIENAEKSNKLNLGEYLQKEKLKLIIS